MVIGASLIVAAVAVLFGASVLGLAIVAPVAGLLGLWIDPLQPFGTAEWGIVASSTCHAIAYTGYVWLVRRAGVAFTSQVGYLVTIAGVLLSGALLAEAYSPWVWAALAVMLAGIVLVQPRRGPASRARTVDAE